MQQNSPTDSELVLNIQQDNCSDSMNELINRHSGIVAAVARRCCSSKYGSGMNVEELNEDIPYIVWRAVDTYDPSYGAKFSTWLYQKARGEIQTRRRKLERDVETVELTDAISDTTPIEEPEQIHADDLEKIEEMKNSINFLKNNRNRAIIRKRYFEEDFKTLGQIAEECDCTLQYASLVTNRFIKDKKKRYER